LGKITIKGTTQVSGHFLKLHFYMFERSQGKHKSLDCHKVFWNIFHLLKILYAHNLTQIKKNLHVQSTQTSKVDSPCFFQTFFFYQMCTIPFENWREF
jgi:hypothetical protein